MGIFAVVTIAYFAAKGIKSGLGHGGSKARVIDYGILALLIGLMVYVFLRRGTTKPPKWMSKLESATPRFAFTIGLLLLSIVPSDLVTSVTIAAHLANEGDPWRHALPFMLLALLLMALPALAVASWARTGQENDTSVRPRPKPRPRPGPRRPGRSGHGTASS